MVKALLLQRKMRSIGDCMKQLHKFGLQPPQPEDEPQLALDLYHKICSSRASNSDSYVLFEPRYAAF